MTAQDDYLVGIIADEIHGYPDESSTTHAKLILTALDRAGYVVVPVKPTEEMVECGRAATAAFHNIQGSGITVAREKMRRRYTAMLSAFKGE